MAAFFSLMVSAGFAAFNAVISGLTSSYWYGALAVYYGLLAITRFFLIFHHLRTRKLADGELKRKKEIKTYRLCGIILVLLSFALVATVLQMAFANISFDSHGLTIYLVAAYTFYKIAWSIFHLVRARKDEDITIRAVRNVNFADALVSVLALQTAMLHEFAPDTNLWHMNALTGMLVCIATVAIGVFMVISGLRKGRKLKKNSTDGGL